jgi:ABC-type proline/glycine betaine transport system ATPase subunit
LPIADCRLPIADLEDLRLYGQRGNQEKIGNRQSAIGNRQSAISKMSFLLLKNISRSFGTTRAVVDVSLDVAQGEFFGLLGPSGCGKTTTLRMIAGLEKPDSGSIEFQGANITNLPPERRGFGMVFQNYALFPHLNVYENVAFGLRARHKTKAEMDERVTSALELVQLPGYGKRAVDELSGGQQQRVANPHYCYLTNHSRISTCPFVKKRAASCANSSRVSA